MDWASVLPLLLQIPIVGAFIIFTLRMVDSYQNEQTKRDAIWQTFLKEERADYLAQEIRRDTEWRTFLSDRSHQNRDALENMVSEMKQMGQNIAALNALLISHDASEREQWARLAVALSNIKGKE